MKKKKTKKIKMTLTFLIILVSLSSLFFIFMEHDNCEKKDNSICKVKIGQDRINLRVAYSDKVQQIGLMWTGHMEENSGMIFVYDSPKYLSFWMKNTLIPLSIAFVEEDGRIESIQDMYPQPGKMDHELPLYQSNTMVKYAIETNIAWFSERNIRPGTYIKIPTKLK